MPTDPSDNSKPSKNARPTNNPRASSNPSSANEVSPVAARIGVAVLGVLILVLGVLAGIAVWGLLTGREVLISGWIYIICFVFAAIGFVPMVRQMRSPPHQDGGASGAKPGQ